MPRAPVDTRELFMDRGTSASCLGTNDKGRSVPGRFEGGDLNLIISAWLETRNHIRDGTVLGGVILIRWVQILLRINLCGRE